MEENPLPHTVVVYVCGNERPEDAPRTCCARNGGLAIRDRLRALVKENGFAGKVRISQSGCMDRCEKGANVMIFPENVWFSAVTEEDADAIFERLKKTF